MRPGRLLAILVALWVTSTFALAARASSHYEEAIQYALENLTSGVSTATSYRGTDVTVTPVRTWKSVSGHYCRRYEITVTEPAAAPDHTEATRCRDNDGVWKKVTEE